MISDGVVKQAFIARAMAEEARVILSLQRTAVSTLGVKEESGALMRALSSVGEVRNTSSGAMMRIHYALHTRFLDMPGHGPRKKGFAIYNRIVYGRIYGNLLRQLQYGFDDTIHSELIKELSQIDLPNISL